MAIERSDTEAVSGIKEMEVELKGASGSDDQEIISRLTSASVNNVLTPGQTVASSYVRFGIELEEIGREKTMDRSLGVGGKEQKRPVYSFREKTSSPNRRGLFLTQLDTNTLGPFVNCDIPTFDIYILNFMTKCESVKLTIFLSNTCRPERTKYTTPCTDQALQVQSLHA
jgi:hypothetical protein